MRMNLPHSARKVKAALHAAGVDAPIVKLAMSARTAQQAADAIGVVVGQIAKSLEFRATNSGRAALVIASDGRRGSETKPAARVGEGIERVPPEFVREVSGFAISGIAPLAHPTAMTTFIDTPLHRFGVVWAAAGTPHCVFPISPDDLTRDAGGVELDVA